MKAIVEYRDPMRCSWKRSISLQFGLGAIVRWHLLY
jgi:hypothetical protein